jgi:hypothetical protein
VSCSAASRERGEPLAGTASTVRAFLLIEEPGPWGVDALRDARLPGDLGARLRDAARRARVRVLLIRRPGRSAAGARRVIAAYADPNEPWLEMGSVPAIEHVLDIDFAGLGAGSSAGLIRSDETVFAVCTHGRHDTCCAERGRPLAQALAQPYPEQTWEVSHIGGDRFAGNLLVLPHGLYYGRVDDTAVTDIADAHLAGRVSLDQLRGRSGLSMPAQAAEFALRRRHGLTSHDDLRFEDSTTKGDQTSVRFATRDGAEHLLRVRTSRGAPERLTCRAMNDSPAPVYEVLDDD